MAGKKKDDKKAEKERKAARKTKELAKANKNKDQAKAKKNKDQAKAKNKAKNKEKAKSKEKAGDRARETQMAIEPAPSAAWNVTALRAHARRLGVPRYSRLTRDELLVHFGVPVDG